MPLALITGASRGLGRALAHALAGRGWDLLLDARDADALAGAVASVPAAIAIPGDVADPAHRADLVAAAAEHGPVALLVNNASTLPASPQPLLADLRTADLVRTLAVNLVAPHALLRDLLPWLDLDGTVVNVTSDASRRPYAGWGAYGPSKAALDHLTAILAVERPRLRAYAVDPGDLATRLHAQAVPDEDLSGLPDPTAVVPALLALLARRPPSGRYRLADVAAPVGGDA